MNSTESPDHEPKRHTRRNLLLATGAGLAGATIGAGGTAAGEDVLAPASQTSAVIPPTEELMREHGVLARTLLVYRETERRLRAGDDLPADALHQAAQIIHDYIQSFHEGLEEAHVFPRLQQADTQVDTVTTLLTQHARGRRLTQQILADATPQGVTTPSTRSQLATAVSQFVRMYEVHEAREDTVIFPAFRELVPDAEFRRLGEQFAEQEDQHFGPHGFADMVQRVTDIENALGIHDLAQFTPET